MVRATPAVFVLPPPVPVMVIVKNPIAHPELVVTCIVAVPEPGAAMDVGVKLTLTPLGRPDTDKPILELKPSITAVLIVELLDLPRITRSALGEALRL